MTNFLISYPDVTLASDVIPVPAGNSLLNEFNLITGERDNYFQFSSSGTSAEITFDSGATSTHAVNHMIIARADWLQDETVTDVILESSPDDIVYTPIIQFATFGSIATVGPRLEDMVDTSALSLAQRYWRVTYTASGSTTFPHSKIYFGQWFDFGVEPDFYNYEKLTPREANQLSVNSVRKHQRLFEPVYQFIFEYSLIPNSVVNDFEQKIVRRIKRNPVFLYTDTDHEILDNHKLVHCTITKYEKRKQHNDLNELTIVFQEIIG